MSQLLADWASSRYNEDLVDNQGRIDVPMFLLEYLWPEFISQDTQSEGVTIWSIRLGVYCFSHGIGVQLVSTI